MWDFVKKQHRDLLAEAAMDMRSYSADPYSRMRLEQNRGGGTAGGSPYPNWPPRNVFVRPEGDGQWIVEADGRLFGPCPNALEAENQMRKHYGQPPLRAERRDWRDDARPADE
jgi:hypothetical protein